jgi:hypothetical protein
LHEFEALLLADPEKLSCEFVEHGQAIADLKEACRGQEPERINEGSTTAPSKRIIAAIPEYDYLKASAGPSVAKQIGLPSLRAACPHFGQWVTTLEGLGT